MSSVMLSCCHVVRPSCRHVVMLLVGDVRLHIIRILNRCLSLHSISFLSHTINQSHYSLLTTHSSKEDRIVDPSSASALQTIQTNTTNKEQRKHNTVQYILCLLFLLNRQQYNKTWSVCSLRNLIMAQAKTTVGRKGGQRTIGI